MAKVQIEPYQATDILAAIQEAIFIVQAYGALCIRHNGQYPDGYAGSLGALENACAAVSVAIDLAK